MEEVEILVELFTPIAKAREATSGLIQVGSKTTTDIYYYDPLRSNLQLNGGKLMECCRIRTKGGICSLTYKIDIYESDRWLYSEEDETEVADKKALLKVFENLGLKELVVVNSVKNIYRNDLYEIVLEEVEELGSFLEVEYIANINGISVYDAKQKIREFIGKLGLEVGPELNSGKPELLLAKRKIF